MSLRMTLTKINNNDNNFIANRKNNKNPRIKIKSTCQFDIVRYQLQEKKKKIERNLFCVY